MVNPSGIRITGALAAHRQGLWDALLERGYSPLSAQNLLRLTAHLSRWLEAQALSLEALTHAHIDAFFETRRCEGYTGFRTPQALAPIRHYLEQLGVIALAPPHRPAPSAVEHLLDAYTDYLRCERALTASTAGSYAAVARRFLHERLGETPNIAMLQARDATAFVLETSSHYSVGTTQYTVTALRSLLRYLYLEGQLAVDLTGALPAVAGGRLRALPKALEPAHVQRLLRSCDRRRHVGRRDYAVLLLLVRLGLRAGEVAALELDDIDWRAGECLARGKGRRQERLPLPNDVGEALARYLRSSRPRTRARALFLTVHAPPRPLSTSTVNAVVYRAAARAGLSAIHAHRLRHTAATQMLRAGASLDEVAQVLRHHSHDTTAIYAKVDRLALHTVVRPWPGATL